MDDRTQSPNRIPWPPLIYAGAFALGWAAEQALPTAGLVGGPPPVVLAMIGWRLVAIGLGLDVATILTLSAARANVLPHRPATRLVTSGPFRLSRNPIYLGNTLVLIGFAGVFASLWMLAAAALAAAAVVPLAIQREEAHLAARFGPDWEAYARRTGRWFG